MRHTVKHMLTVSLSVLLVLSMVLGMPLSVMAASTPAPATAAVKDVDGDGKITYVSFGDSVTNGYGMDGYRYPDGTNVLGYTREAAAAYPAQTAAYLESKGFLVDLKQMAISGYRMNELDWMLDPSAYKADQYHTAHFADRNKTVAKNMLSGADADAFRTQAKALGFSTDADIIANADKVISAAYIQAVQSADLVTLDLSSNHFGAFMADVLAYEMGLSGTEVVVDFTQYLDKNSAASLDAVAAQMAAKLAGSDASVLKLTTALVRSMMYGYLSFVNHYDAAMAKIYALNPNAQVVVLDGYSMMTGLDMGANADLNEMYALFVELANQYASSQSPWASKTTHAALDAAPEILADYVKAYEANKAAGTYASSQNMHPDAEALLNDLVMEMLGMDYNDPNVRASFQNDVMVSSAKVVEFVNNMKTRTHEYIFKPALDAVAAAQANVNDSVEGVAMAQTVVNMVVELAIDGEYKDQFKGSATSGLFKKAAISVIKDTLSENEDMMVQMGVEPTDANKDKVAEEVYYVACIYYDEMHRDGGSRESANKLAVLEIMRFVLILTRGMSEEEAVTNANLAYQLNEIYQAELEATKSKDKAMKTATLAALKANPKYAGEGVAESLYRIHEGTYTEADVNTALALRGITGDLAKAMVICATQDVNGQFNNSNVRTVTVYVMEQDMGVTNAEAKFDACVQYQNAAATLGKIANVKSISLSALAANQMDGKAFADKFMNAKLDLSGAEASVAAVYFRFLALEGAFSHPTAAGHAKLAAAVKAAVEKLNVAEADSEIVMGAGEKALVLGDIAASAENSFVDPNTTVNLSAKGFRVNEVRALLDSTYAGDAYTAAVLGQNKAELSKQYTDAVKASNVILVHLGAMNIGFAVEQLDAFVASKNPYAMNYASIGDMAKLGQRMDALLAKMADESTAAQTLAFESLRYGYASFADSLDKTVEAIQKLNPNADIILVGQYGLVDGAYYEAGGIRVELGQLAGDIVDRMNTYLKNYAEMTDNVTFIDITGAETVLSTSADKNVAGKDVFAAKVVPTAKGAEYIAKRLGCAMGGHTPGSEDQLTWSWSGNHAAATATYICQKCEFPVELNAKVTKEEVKYCDKAGEATYTATVNIGKDVTNTVKVSVAPMGHSYGDPVWAWEQDLSMASASFTCVNSGCKNVETIPAVITSQITEPGCETAGKNTLTAAVSAQGKDYTDVKEAPIPAKGHTYANPVWAWAEDGSTASATLTCDTCAGTTTLEGEVSVEASKAPNCYVDGEVKYVARVEQGGYEYLDRKTVVIPAGHKYVDGICTVCGDDINDYNIYRLYGDNRFQTSLAVADALKAELGVTKFDNIIIASGSSYADALAGSYLAAVKNAPILITNSKNQEIIQMYAFANLKTGGTMYILGGESAVQPSFESGMSGFTTMKRLAGDNRYDTNLEILKEAALTPGSEILVCTGRGFADSLSASAVGKPILLVRDNLNENQKAYLATLGTANKFVIIGGESAVGAVVAEELKAYGSVERVNGNDRYETSVAVAERFFADSKPESAVLAYGRKFPDGLCGGPLAYFSGAPLLLTQSGKEAAADAYTDKYEIQKGYVLGGQSVVSDETAFIVFDLETEAEKQLLVEKKNEDTEESLMGSLGGNLGDNLGDLDQDDLEDLLGNLLPGIFG